MMDSHMRNVSCRLGIDMNLSKKSYLVPFIAITVRMRKIVPMSPVFSSGILIGLLVTIVAACGNQMSNAFQMRNPTIVNLLVL